MIGIKKVEDGYTVFYERAEDQLWAYDYEFNRKQKELEKIKSDHFAEYEEKLNKLKQQYPKKYNGCKTCFMYRTSEIQQERSALHCVKPIIHNEQVLPAELRA